MGVCYYFQYFRRTSLTTKSKREERCRKEKHCDCGCSPIFLWYTFILAIFVQLGMDGTLIISQQTESNKGFKKHHTLKMLVTAIVLFYLTFCLLNFFKHSYQLAPFLSDPQIILEAQTKDGRVVKIDDFRGIIFF